MPTLVYTHPVYQQHETGDHHPERPARLEAVNRGLESTGVKGLMPDREEPPMVNVERIKAVHDPAYVDRVFASIPETGHRGLDSDTVVSPKSGEAALRAAGAVVDAVDQVVAGRARNAFCAVRPPGHHAEADHAMGFCLFNNIAIAAFHAMEQHGFERVAAVDFDVHHGNGTQHAFWNHAGLFYGSSHQAPLFPGTGHENEHGAHNNIYNAELPPGSGGDTFRSAWADNLLPHLAAFEPQMLFISAGFDAHAQDPLAQLRVTTDDFAWLSRELVRVADQACGGRVVSVLEGGYDLDALQACTGVHLRALMGS